jgi:hypothetical protein
MGISCWPMNAVFYRIFNKRDKQQWRDQQMTVSMQGDGIFKMIPPNLFQIQEILQETDVKYCPYLFLKSSPGTSMYRLK